MDDNYSLTLNKYQRDNLLWLLSLVMLGDLPRTNTGDWVGELFYMLGGKIGYDANGRSFIVSDESSTDYLGQTIQDKLEYWRHDVFRWVSAHSNELIGDLTNSNSSDDPEFTDR